MNELIKIARLGINNLRWLNKDLVKNLTEKGSASLEDIIAKHSTLVGDKAALANLENLATVLQKNLPPASYYAKLQNAVKGSPLLEDAAIELKRGYADDQVLEIANRLLNQGNMVTRLFSKMKGLGTSQLNNSMYTNSPDIANLIKTVDKGVAKGGGVNYINDIIANLDTRGSGILKNLNRNEQLNLLEYLQGRARGSTIIREGVPTTPTSIRNLEEEVNTLIGNATRDKNILLGNTPVIYEKRMNKILDTYKNIEKNHLSYYKNSMSGTLDKIKPKPILFDAPPPRISTFTVASNAMNM